MNTRCTRCGGSSFWVAGCTHCDPNPATEIARLKAELAEARESIRYAERVMDGCGSCFRKDPILDVARDFLTKHPEEP